LGKSGRKDKDAGVDAKDLRTLRVKDQGVNKDGKTLSSTSSSPFSSSAKKQKTEGGETSGDILSSLANVASQAMYAAGKNPAARYADGADDRAPAPTSQTKPTSASAPAALAATRTPDSHPSDLKVLRTFTHGDVVCSLTLSNPFRLVFTGGKGVVKIWDSTAPQDQPLTSLPCLVSHFYFYFYFFSPAPLGPASDPLFPV